MESTISTYYNPQMKISYNPDFCQANPCVINKLSQFNAFNSSNGYNQNACNPNSYTYPRPDDQRLNNLKAFNLSIQPKMSQLQRNPSLQRSNLKPTSGSVLTAQHVNQPNGHLISYSSNLNSNQSSVANSHSTNQPTSRTGRREIPRLPNAVIMNKLTSNSSQSSNLNSSTLSSVSTLPGNQNVQRNALQSPAFGECRCLSLCSVNFSEFQCLVSTAESYLHTVEHLVRNIFIASNCFITVIG